MTERNSWPSTSYRRRDDGAHYHIGDRVIVVDQPGITGNIVSWDGGRAVILDDERDTWRFDIEPEGEEGTLTFSLWDLIVLEND
tara:strand:+ start:763 stop:1014 length:252 start_codon:yes stop_codon:yes gene_type:complete